MDRRLPARRGGDRDRPGHGSRPGPFRDRRPPRAPGAAALAGAVHGAARVVHQRGEVRLAVRARRPGRDPLARRRARWRAPPAAGMARERRPAGGEARAAGLRLAPGGARPAPRPGWRGRARVRSCRRKLPYRHAAGRGDFMSGDARTVRALVVEDEFLLLALLEELLPDLGVEVAVCARSLDGALAAARDPARFDIALVDVNLGGEQSYDAVEALLQAGVPTRCITGYGSGSRPPLAASVPGLGKPSGSDDLSCALATKTAGQAQA